MAFFTPLTRLSVAVLLLMLMACKPGGGSSSDSDAPEVDAPEIIEEADPVEVDDPPVEDPPALTLALEGTWDLCIDLETGSSTRVTYVFEGKAYSYRVASYLTQDCSGEPIVAMNDQWQGGTFELLEETVDENGASARETNFHVELARGTPIPNADQYYLYNVVGGPTDNTLYFSGVWRFTPEDRPTALNFEEPYLRRE